MKDHNSLNEDDSSGGKVQYMDLRNTEEIRPPCLEDRLDIGEKDGNLRLGNAIYQERKSKKNGLFYVSSFV